MTNVKYIGKYELVEEIGRGGFAVVYRALDTNMDREVALKVILGSVAHEKSFVDRFRQEVRVAANLRHPNIMPVYDFGDAGGNLYLAMPFIGQGRTLRDLLAERGRMPLDEAVSLLTQLANGLDCLHSQEPPLVHRDVKPANVMLEGLPSQVILADFGLVRSMEASAELTQSGSILGSPAYMAPEQADAKQWGEVTPLADVYALGVIVYEMLVGQVPFEGDLPSVIRAHAYEPPPLPLELASDLGDDLVAILTRGLAKPPKERYPSAGAIVAALQEVAEARVRRERRQAELSALLNQAEAAREAGDWLAVQRLCVQIMQEDRAHPEAMKMMTDAMEGLQRENAEEAARRERVQQYEEGVEALRAGQWETAIAAFEDVERGNPDFRDVQARLAQAHEELQRATWYAEAVAYGEKAQWPEACRLWVQVLRGRLNYRQGEAAGRLLDAVKGWLELWDEMSLEEALLKARQSAPIVSEPEPELEEEEELPAWLTENVAREITGERMIWEKDGKEMVRVPAGPFLYGDDKEERELPEFWIDKTPVTNAEYARFVVETGHDPPGHWKGKTPPKKIADHPVVYVSWHDAQTYAEWAGKRLPTEEEWEKAARGTDGRKYPWGDEPPTFELCNFAENEGGTTPVGKYSPQGDSPYGCVDMVGNVWEWTSSKYHERRRVLRGGAFDSDARIVRWAFRSGHDPYSRFTLGGFRVVVVPFSPTSEL